MPSSSTQPSTHDTPTTTTSVSQPASRFMPDRFSGRSEPAEPITVWLLDEPECRPLEAFIGTAPEATLFHTLAWRDALVEAGLGKPAYLAAMSGDRVVGLLPLFEIWPDDARAETPELLGLPGTPPLGALVESEPIGQLLMMRAARMAQGRGIRAFTIREFRPRDPHGWFERQPRWLRVPLPVLLEQKPAAAADAPDVEFQRGGDHSGFFETVRRAERSASDRAPGALRSFVAANSAVETAIARNVAGQTLSAAICVQFRERMHVLALGPETAPAAAQSRLLTAIARRAATLNARTLDFPFPAAPDFWFMRLLSMSGIEIDFERTISLGS